VVQGIAFCGHDGGCDQRRGGQLQGSDRKLYPDDRASRGKFREDFVHGGGTATGAKSFTVQLPTAQFLGMLLVTGKRPRHSV